MRYDPAQFTRQEREAYNQVAEAWAANVAGNTALYSRRMLEGLAPRPGESLLDLACGAGHLALDGATRFQCRAIGVDVSEGMLQQARRKGVSVDFLQGDAEHLPFAAETFDLAASGLGLMYFPDTARALAEIRRVLRPGGRAGFVVWTLPPRVPCLTLAMSAMAQITAPLAARGLLRLPGIGDWLLFRAVEDTIPGKGPSPLRFGRPGKLARILHRAGFRQVEVFDDTVVWRYSSFDDFWRSFAKSTPALTVPPREAVGRIRARLERLTLPYRDAFGELAFPMTALLVRARR